MSFYSVAKSLTGRVPNTPLSLAQTAVQDALGMIYDMTDWSFQRTITYANWLCPGNVANIGTYTVAPYVNTVTADGAATNALAVGLAKAGIFATTLQFRNPAYSIYNIVGVGNLSTICYLQVTSPGSNQIPGTYIVNAVGGTGSGAVASILVSPNGEVNPAPLILNPGTGYTPGDGVSFPLAAGGTPATFNALLNTVLTLDRPWLEPTTGSGQNYMIYQAYFVAPVADFRKFIEVRDTTNSARLDFWSMTQADLSIEDPQRTEFADPSYVVPAGIDQRPNSTTQGYQMFELCPQQLSYIPYSFSYRRRGIIPQTFNDFQSMTTPYPITEEFLTWRAKETLFQDAAARMESKTPGSGKGMMMLGQSANKESMRLYSEILSIDMNINSEMFTKIEGRGRLSSNRPYSNQLGGLNIGGFPER
jgi:hypothetical protein